MTTIFIIVFGYNALLVLIGYIASKRIKSSTDYYLGGKSAGPVLTAFRFASTFESGSMMVGVPGLGYKFGYVTYNQGFLGPLGYFFSFRVFGQRVKVACDHYDSITVPDLLERHYKSPALKTVGSIAIIIGLTGSIIAQLKAMGEVFSALLNLKYTHGVLIGLVIIAVYSLLGGYLGNAFANVAQGVLMVGGSIILFVATNIAFFNGKFTLSGMFPAINDYMASEVGPHTLTMTGGGILPMSTIIAMLIVALTIGLALPQQTVALFAMKDKSVGKMAMIISAFFSFICYWTLVPAGMMANAVVPGIENPDNVIPTLALSVLSPVLAGIFIAGVLSAIMSTASNLFLVVGASISRDILKTYAPKVYDKKPVMYDRLATLLVLAVSLAIALNPPAIIFHIIVFAFTMIALTFLMPMLGLIYWKKATKQGALAAMLVGAVFIPVWSFIGEPGLPALLIAMIAAPLLFIVISLMTQRSRDNVEEVETLFRAFKES